MKKCIFVITSLISCMFVANATTAVQQRTRQDYRHARQDYRHEYRSEQERAISQKQQFGSQGAQLRDKRRSDSRTIYDNDTSSHSYYDKGVEKSDNDQRARSRGDVRTVSFQNDGGNRSLQTLQKPVQPKLPAITLKGDGEYIIGLMVGYFDTRGAQKIKENFARVRKSLQAKAKETNNEREKPYLREMVEMISQIEADLQTLLETKNTISSIIEDKINFDHPFFKDTLLTFFYMLSYVDTERLKETARHCRQIAFGNRKAEDIRELSDSLELFCVKIEGLIDHLEDFMIKCDDDLLRQIDGENGEDVAIEEGTRRYEHSGERGEQYRSARNESERISTQRSDGEAQKTIPQRWPYLANLLAAFNRYASTQPRKSLSSIENVDELMRSMLTNLRSIERKSSTITKTITTIENAQEEFEEAATSRKIRLLSNVTSAYNDAVNGNRNFNAITDAAVLRLKRGVFSFVFEDLINKLDEIKEKGKLRGTYATAVEDAIDGISDYHREFENSNVTETKKRIALETVFTVFNNAIKTLKGRESADPDWTELKETMSTISADTKTDTLNAYKTFVASPDEKTTANNRNNSTVSRSPALNKHNDTSRTAKEEEKGKKEEEEKKALPPKKLPESSKELKAPARKTLPKTNESGKAVAATAAA
ncbi:MAG: hypothetical protein K6C34_04000 [Alphaproteobacteria bacterium]|nr:hypothetical protein [Alphaproteobacteria bacterium]